MATKRINELTQTASQADLKTGRYGVIDTPDGTKRLPGNLIGGSGSGSGSISISIYPSLQDAIDDESSLTVGDVFETNGFHSSGDGGAARYVVNDTGTANDMDIIQLGTNKLAIAQLSQSAYTEQIGYEVSADKLDVGPYIKRLLALGIQHIKFRTTPSYPTKNYAIRDVIDFDRSDYHNVGVTLDGQDVGNTSGYASVIEFIPSNSNSDKTMFSVRARTTRLRNLTLIYSNGASSAANRGTSSCIKFNSDGATSYYTASYGCKFENLTIQGFNAGIRSAGVSPYLWHCDFDKITMSLNDKNVEFGGLVYCTTFRNCLFNKADVDNIHIQSTWTLKFDSCNFGIELGGETIVRISEWAPSGAPVEKRCGSVLFTNCNFELEYNSSHSVPSNNSHLFFYVDDGAWEKIELDNCIFIVTPLAREQVYSNRQISLGSGSAIEIRNTHGPFNDVNYTGNEFYAADFDKLVFDENRPPEKTIGSLKLINCVGIDPLPFLDNAHLPCLIRNDESIKFSNSTKILENFDGISDGCQILNLDNGKLYVKVGSELIAVSPNATNKVRIQNELYDYVVIDGLKWITRNLNLRTKTPNRQKTFHPEYGQYYKYSDLSTISSMLPSGWRIPVLSDITALVGDGSSSRAYSLQKVGQPDWPNATNSTGFSAVESTWWYKPNTSPHTTFGKYMFLFTAALDGANPQNISISPTSVSRGGWSPSDAAGLWIPIRVCSDA